MKNLSSIEKKVDMLMEYCDALKEQNELLLVDNEHLRNRFLEISNDLKDLEEKHRILKLAKSVAVTDEKTLDIKTKINEFVREIDKCISILSK